MNFSEISLSEAVEFARITPAKNARQQKDCKKGWSCGYTCLPRTKKNCFKGLEGQAKTLTDWLARNAPEASGKTVSVPPLKEARKRFEEIGEGANGVVFRDGSIAYKYNYGNIDQNEIKIGTKAGELGVGPKILVSNSKSYAMEFLDDYTPLSDVIYDAQEYKGRKDTNAIAHSILDSAETLHKNDIAHNDMHPGNIMVGANGEIKIIDYGYASNSLDDIVSDIDRFKERRYLTQTVDGEKLKVAAAEVVKFYDEDFLSRSANEKDVMKKIAAFYDLARSLDLTARQDVWFFN